MTAMDYANRFESLAIPHRTNNTSRHLIDANCDYAEGAFRLSCLPPELPILFTVRFTAPADFTPGDVLTLKGQDYAVRTRTMEEPEGKLFSAGAVVQCDIDMERELAFFAAGGDAGQPCGCQYQTGHLSFYIDPNGDDSLSNPGTIDSPFKTLAGARNAVSQRYIFTSMGYLFYNINPGTYELDEDSRNAICNATHPQTIVFQASDPDNKPLLIASQFSSVRGQRIYANLRLESTETYVVSAQLNTAHITLRGVELIARAPNARFIYACHYGVVALEESLVLDGCGNPADMVFGCYTGEIRMFSAISHLPVTIRNLPSVRIFAYCGNGNLYLHSMTFTGTTSGRRYIIERGGAINTNGGGANYFPGSTAGTIVKNDLYS